MVILFKLYWCIVLDGFWTHGHGPLLLSSPSLWKFYFSMFTPSISSWGYKTGSVCACVQALTRRQVGLAYWWNFTDTDITDIDLSWPIYRLISYPLFWRLTEMGTSIRTNTYISFLPIWVNIGRYRYANPNPKRWCPSCTHTLCSQFCFKPEWSLALEIRSTQFCDRRALPNVQCSFILICVDDDQSSC